MDKTPPKELKELVEIAKSVIESAEIEEPPVLVDRKFGFYLWPIEFLFGAYRYQKGVTHWFRAHMVYVHHHLIFHLTLADFAAELSFCLHLPIFGDDEG